MELTKLPKHCTHNRKLCVCVCYLSCVNQLGNKGITTRQFMQADMISSWWCHKNFMKNNKENVSQY